MQNVTQAIAPSAVMQNVMAIATQDLPLTIVLQQCNDKEHLSPVNNFTAWLQCLQEVYVARQPKPTAAEYADAIQTVWSTVLTRTILTNALLGLNVYAPLDVYVQVDRYYPVTLNIVVDTTATIQNGYAILTVTDDNNDPNQGSNEITVNARVGNQLIWRARSLNGSDVVHLQQFVFGGGTQLFSNGGPKQNADGSWQGTLADTGNEVYHFLITVNTSPQQYMWDPFINCTA